MTCHLVRLVALVDLMHCLFFNVWINEEKNMMKQILLVLVLLDRYETDYDWWVCWI